MDFPCCSAHCPVTFGFLSISLLMGLVAKNWPGMNVNSDFSTFLVADGRASALDMAWTGAKEFLGPTKIDVRRLGFEEPYQNPEHIWDEYKLKMMYARKDGSSMLTLGALREMLNVELELRAMSGWRQLCNESGIYRAMCEPGFSVPNSVWLEWPAQDPTPTMTQHQYVTCNVTGKGRDPLDLDAAMALLQNRELVELLFPKDFKIGDKPLYLSSNFYFRMFRGTVYDAQDSLAASSQANNQKFKEWMADELFPTLNTIRRTHDELEVYWEGTFIFEHAVWTAMQSDAYMALGSCIFIVCYLAFHTRSVMLSIGALLLTIMGIPVGFVSMALLTGSNTLTGASFLSLFLIIGLGADVVLVFVSFWNMSKEESEDYPTRVKYLYRNAGTASAATSMTTACSFFANLASVLRPLREFGFFMGLCIIWTYCFLVLGFPGLLYINERLGRCCCGCRGSAERESSFRQCITIKMGSKAMCRAMTNCGNLQRTFVSRCLIPCRRSCCCFFVVIPIIAAAWTATVATPASGEPQLFPADNNEYWKAEVLTNFPDGYPTSLVTQTVVCNVGQSTPGRADPSGDCGLNWCDIEHHSIEVKWYGNVDLDSGNTTCECKPVVYENREGNCFNADINRAATSIVQTRLVGAENVPDEFWQSEGWMNHIREVVLKHNPGVQLARTSTRYSQAALSKLVQMHWESGMTQVVPYLLAPEGLQVINKGHSGRICRVEEVCYCGTPACRLWEEHQNSDQVASDQWTEVQIPQLLSGEGRRLDDEPSAVPEQPSLPLVPLQMHQAGSVGGRSAAPLGVPILQPGRGRQLSMATTPVHLVWGIKVEDTSNLLGDVPDTLWSFDPNFRPEAPTVQRFLMSVCKEIMTRDVLVLQQVCWVQHFRSWLYDQGTVFPARSEDFSSLIDNFAREVWIPDGGEAGNFLWFSPDGRLRAAYYSFQIDLARYTAGTAETLSAKTKWDQYVENLNLNAPVGADEAWHNSKSWIRVEASQAILSSTLDSMILSSACGFFGALVSTHFDVWLSVFALFAVIGVTLLLAWFICVFLGWTIGAIEVLGLIIFVGYSITYSLHIAHKYREGIRETEQSDLSPRERREFAVRFALTAMTSAIVGSAVTTLGASFFLFFCTISIFVKVASILFAVTFFAAIYSVMALPVALLLIGPIGLCSPKRVSITVVRQMSDLGSRLSRGSLRSSLSLGSGAQSQGSLGSLGSSDGNDEVATRSGSAVGDPSEVIVTVH